MEENTTTTEIAIIELPEPVRQLAEASGLPQNESKALAIGFVNFFTDLDALKQRIETEINMVDPGPEDEKLAGEFRKLIKSQRTTANNYRQIANEKVLAVQRLNNGIFKLVEDNTKPLEDTLSKIENAAKIKEEARLTALEADRKAALAPFEVDTEFYDLKNMPEEKWAAFFNQQKTSYEAVKAQKEQQAIKDNLHAERLAIASEFPPNQDITYYGDMSKADFDALITGWKEQRAKEFRKGLLHANRLKDMATLGYSDSETFLGNLTDEAYDALYSEWKEKKTKADRDAEIKRDGAYRQELLYLAGLLYVGEKPLGEMTQEEYEDERDRLLEAKNRVSLVTEMRLQLSKLGVFMSMAEVDALSDGQYSTLYTDSLAAFELAEQEKAENEQKENLQQTRLSDVTPYIAYGQELDLTNLWVFTPEKWSEIIAEKKEAYQKKHDDLYVSRVAELASFGYNGSLIGLGFMSESEYQGVLLQTKTEFEEKQSQAPDKDKLSKFKAELDALKVPELTSTKGGQASDFIKERISALNLQH